jgi:hypothetical protein
MGTTGGSTWGADDSASSASWSAASVKADSGVGSVGSITSARGSGGGWEDDSGGAGIGALKSDAGLSTRGSSC